MIVPRRPRRWTLAVATVAIAATGWLALAPVTVVYTTSHNAPAPQIIATHYSWSSTEQNFLYSDTGTGRRSHLVDGVRLNCSNLLGTGVNELAHAPAGPRACAAIETPKLIAALPLFTVGVVGLLGAPLIPTRSRQARNRYRQPYRQRRALKRAR